MPTTKQIGDACEMLVAARLTLAGNPATVMPDGWPHYDLIAQPPDRSPQRISVKTRYQGSTHTFHFSPEGCDWIAFVFLPATGTERIWILPVDDARNISASDGVRRRLPLARLAEQLNNWESNFCLSEGDSATHPVPTGTLDKICYQE
jgi:hypothetical protein